MDPPSPADAGRHKKVPLKRSSPGAPSTNRVTINVNPGAPLLRPPRPPPSPPPIATDPPSSSQDEFTVPAGHKQHPFYTNISASSDSLSNGSEMSTIITPTPSNVLITPNTISSPAPTNVTSASGSTVTVNGPVASASTTAPPKRHRRVRSREELAQRLSETEQSLKEIIGRSQLELEIKDPSSDFLPINRTDTATSADDSCFSYEEYPNGLRRRRANTFSDEEIKNIPRLVHRNLPFKQSRQELAVVNKTIFRSIKLQRILTRDFFHIFLRQPTWLSLSMLLSIWTATIMVFALIYQKIDRDKPATECGLGKAGEPIKFAPAFAFSLETCTTVGYGLPNSTNGFFETECINLQVAICFQMIWSMLFNGFLFAFLFARTSRCEKRGAQMLFSDKAIIEVRDGKWMLHVRIYDFDAAQPVVEAHVKMYCVSWRDYERQTRHLVQPHLLHHMRVLQPTDELGANLFTSIPACVTHQIDAFSPLAPLKVRRRTKHLDDAGLPLREADQQAGIRNGVLCPVCGETFGTIDRLKRHVEYKSLEEETYDNFPLTGSHRDTTILKPALFKPFSLTEEDIREQLRDKEIMVVVEAIEPMVSGSFQALQSYKLNDIVFGGRFEPCMSQQDGKIFVDVDKFHRILPPNDVSVHKYSFYNGGVGRLHQVNAASYLPKFFRNPNPKPDADFRFSTIDVNAGRPTEVTEKHFLNK